MANSTIKTLTLAEIQKVDKKLDAKKVVYVELEGKKYKVTVDEVFRKSKQASLLDDFVKFMTTVEDKGSLDLSEAYTKLLMIKHFTDLKVSDNVAEAIQMLKMLIDLDLLDQIVNELPEDETIKMLELIAKNMNDLNEQYKEIAQFVKNEELKEVLLDEQQ